MLVDLASDLFNELRKTSQSILFCESCTAGLATATLGRFPGVSEVLTGAFVVYQTATKHDWLGLDSLILNHPGPVSESVTRELAQRGLLKSPTATICAAVTGHLGPSASIAAYEAERRSSSASDAVFTEDDGTVFVAIAARANSKVYSDRFQLTCPVPSSVRDHHARADRQAEATALVYQAVLRFLRSPELGQQVRAQ